MTKTPSSSVISKQRSLWNFLKESVLLSWSSSSSSKELLTEIDKAVEQLSQLFNDQDSRSVFLVVADIVSLVARNETVSSIDKCTALAKFCVETLLSLERAIFVNEQQQQNTNKNETGGSDNGEVNDFAIDESLIMIEASSGFATMSLAMEFSRDVLENFVTPSQQQGDEQSSSSYSQMPPLLMTMTLPQWKEHFKAMSGLRASSFEEAIRRIKSVMPIVRTSLGILDGSDNNKNNSDEQTGTTKNNSNNNSSSLLNDNFEDQNSNENDERQAVIHRLRQKLRERYSEEFYEISGSRAIKLGSVFTTLRIQSTSSSSNNNNNDNNTGSGSNENESSKSSASVLPASEHEGEIVSGSSLPDRIQILQQQQQQQQQNNNSGGGSTATAPKIVLIEGAAGCGKTTLTKQLVTEQAFKDAILIFVPLASLHGIRIDDVSTLLSCCASGVLTGDEMDLVCGTKSSKNTRESDDATAGFGIPVMWFLDGFDEVQHTTDPNLSSFLKNFVDPRTRALHYFDSKFKTLVRKNDLVVMSSREERSINPKSGCNLEFGNTEQWVIMKWSDNEIKQYCTKWFGSVLLSGVGGSNVNNNNNNNINGSSFAAADPPFHSSSSSSQVSDDCSSASSTDTSSFAGGRGKNDSSIASSSPTTTAVGAVMKIMDSRIDEATSDVLCALRQTHMEYFAGLPLIVNMLCEIRLELGTLTHISPSSIFEEMTKLHWNRSRRRIFDRLMRLTTKQQQELNQNVYGYGNSSRNNSSAKQRMERSQKNLFTAMLQSASDSNNSTTLASEEFQQLYNYVVSSASETGYHQLVNPKHEDVTSLTFSSPSALSTLGSSSSSSSSSAKSHYQQQRDLCCRGPNGAKSNLSGFGSSSPFTSSDLPLWALLLSETGLLRFIDARRGRFPHRSYIEYLCARYAFSFPSHSMSQVENAHTILWSPKFATVWLLIADFVVNNNNKLVEQSSSSSVVVCHNNHVPEKPLSIERLSAHISVLYTRTYEQLVDRKNTSATESHIPFATAELIGVPLLLRLSMILASSSGSDSSSCCFCLNTINPRVDALLSMIKAKHGVFGMSLRTPRHFLWLAEHSGAVGALDAFKWIRKVYGSDVINEEIASAALSRALDKQQDRPSIANFIKVLVDPPLSIPITLASAIKVGSLAGVTRAMDQEHAANDKKPKNEQLCFRLKRELPLTRLKANETPELLVERAKWRQYLAKCLRKKWFDVAATMLRLRPREWMDIFLDIDSLPKKKSLASNVNVSHVANLLRFIAFYSIPSEIQVWDSFTNSATVKKKDALLYPRLFGSEDEMSPASKEIVEHSDDNNNNNSNNNNDHFFNCDDTIFEVFPNNQKNKLRFRQFTFVCHDVRHECDSEFIFLNNTNGWINIISALLQNECNSVIAQNQRQINNNPTTRMMRISKIELCQKKVKFTEEFLASSSSSSTTSSTTSLKTSDEWKDKLEYEDPRFNAQRPPTSSSSSAADDIADCFCRDVRVRRITFTDSSPQQQQNRRPLSPYVTSFVPASSQCTSSMTLSPTLLTHLDFSHLDPTSAMNAEIEDGCVSIIFRCSPLLTHVDVSFTRGVITDMAIKELFEMKRKLFSKKLNNNSNHVDFPYLEFLDVTSTNCAITDACIASFSDAELIPIFANLKAFRFAECKGKITDRFLIKIIKSQTANGSSSLVLEDIDCRSTDGKCTDKFIDAYVEACRTCGNCPLKRFACSGAVLESPDSSVFVVTRAFFSANATGFHEESMARLFKIANQLEHLDVSFTSRNIPNAAIKEICSTKLKFLDISGTGAGITDETIEFLVRKNPLLHTFRNAWNSSAITDVTMKAIGECCPNLAVLDISWSVGIGDVGLEAVVAGCKKLRYVSVKSNGGKITTRSLLALARGDCRDLRIVNALLTGGLVNQKVVTEAFKETNPLCCVKCSIVDRTQDV